jgi:hypothetical protein
MMHVYTSDAAGRAYEHLRRCACRLSGDGPALSLGVASVGDAMTGINRADSAAMKDRLVTRVEASMAVAT